MSLAQLSQLLPLGNEELQQILDYAASLSKTEAAVHFQDLLGDSPLAFDFISSFNSQRGAQESASTAVTASQSGFEPSEAFAKFKGDSKKKKKGTAIHTPVVRAVEQCQGPADKAYNKKDQHVDYIPQHASAPDGSQSSRAATTSTLQPPKQHPSTAGYLISDGPQKAKTKSTPKPCTAKVSVAGGTPMTGQSTVLFDLDAVIRALEVMTNLSMDKGTMDKGKRSKCNCVATRHPLQSAAPNCLACGKVICLKEGLGPCSFCGSLLLSTDEIQAMLRELKDDRGRERMAAHAAAHRKADVAKTPTPFTPRRGEDVGKEGESLDEAASRAREHRDKLLNFQTQNARRTTVRDEAADFDVSGAMAGTGNLWASAEERVRELKRQQKLMREMEWNVQPDYEKRTQVVSIDLVGGKVVRKMATIERPTTPDEVEAPQNTSRGTKNAWHEGQTGGAFSHNPLLGALMRPVFAPPRDEKGAEQKAGTKKQQTKRWRRVQDDAEDNEEVILDGELYGHGSGRTGGEAACG